MSQAEATSRWAREINIEQSHSQSYKQNLMKKLMSDRLLLLGSVGLYVIALSNLTYKRTLFVVENEWISSDLYPIVIYIHVDV